MIQNNKLSAFSCNGVIIIAVMCFELHQMVVMLQRVVSHYSLIITTSHRL